MSMPMNCAASTSPFTDSQILASEVDVSRIEQWQHAFTLQLFQILIISHLHFVHQVYRRKKFPSRFLECGIL